MTFQNIVTISVVVFFTGCVGLQSWQVQPGEIATKDTEAEPVLLDEEIIELESEEIVESEYEEEVYVDPTELNALISSLAKKDKQDNFMNLEPITKTDDLYSKDTKSATQNPKNGPVYTASNLWNMTSQECLGALKEENVKTLVPKFKTPFVKAPLLLDGEINGITVRANWTKNNPINEVMDCRLILALVEVAELIKQYKVKEIVIYSAYRPLVKPTGDCKNGKKGKKCKAAKRAYEKAKQGKMSQHRRATAIDIGWFVKDDGEKISVLDHYERRSNKPPCDDHPASQKGIFLKELACALHQMKIFNVVLTPNANKAHHNHFHLDITPGAQWHIIR